MKLFGGKKGSNSGFGLDNLIEFLVLFGIAIIVIAVMLFFNKFV